MEEGPLERAVRKHPSSPVQADDQLPRYRGGAFLNYGYGCRSGWASGRKAGAAEFRWLAAIPSVLGFAVALRCVWDFGWTGRGTPAPFIPPQRLVVVGFYRCVRNPMYVGFAVGWIGLWIVFAHANPVAIASAAAVALGIHLFVVFYEERRCAKVQADYRVLRECRAVVAAPAPLKPAAITPREYLTGSQP